MKSLYSLLALTIFLNACSVLVGQVKPVEEKAPLPSAEKIIFPAANWKKLDIPSGTQSNEDIPDAAWQSGRTAAVVSLNSVCRQDFDEDGDIKRVTKMLLSQWDSLKVDSERSLTISGFQALETTGSGSYLDRSRRFQTVVVKSPTCVYDLVYLSPVETFPQELSVFQKFRDNLNLK